MKRHTLSWSSLVAVLLVAMTLERLGGADALLPSQVVGRGGAFSSTTTSSTPRCNHQPLTTLTSFGFLVPSQVVSSSSAASCRFPSSLRLTAASASTEEEARPSSPAPAASTTITKHHTSRRSRRRKRPSKAKSKFHNHHDPTNSNPDDRAFATTGNLPDPWYRSIPWEHVRAHPRIRPLPANLTVLDTLADVQNFRQDSWQWQALHTGRCTTSQAAAALCFLDPTAAQVLRIPPAWRRGAHRAFERLSQTPVLRSLADMQEGLLLSPETTAEASSSSSPDTSVEEVSTAALWREPSSTEEEDATTAADGRNVTSFVADYLYEPTAEEIQTRRAYVKERSGGDYLSKGIRLIWGNTQEATSVLTALNYFAKEDPDVSIREVGMCGAGLALNQTSMESSLLVGASPDGVLCHGDGRIEVLEVKNHCPFFSNGDRKRRNNKLKMFSVGDRPLGHVGVLAQYVPQMQMEMYCLGPDCRSAVMVRQTAAQGAVLLRMQRDDEWIEEMLYFLHSFQRDYVQAQQPPPSDFFWDGPEATRYREFVNLTVQVRDSVNVIATLTNEEIQRASAAPYFLD